MSKRKRVGGYEAFCCECGRRFATRGSLGRSLRAAAIHNVRRHHGKVVSYVQPSLPSKQAGGKREKTEG